MTTVRLTRRLRSVAALLVAVPLLVVVSACGASPGSASGGDGDVTVTTGMEVSGAFVPEPAGSVAALYFTVRNGTGRDDALVGVDTGAADATDLHETREEGGRVTMRSLERVAVPAGEVVVFAPLGRHVMLVDVAPLREGDTVEVTLRFAEAPPVTVTVPVGALGSTEPPADDRTPVTAAG